MHRGASAYSYFLHDSTTMLSDLKADDAPAPGSSIMTCSLAMRRKAVKPPPFVLPAGVSNLNRLLAYCRRLIHFNSSHPEGRLVWEWISTRPPFHVRILPETRGHYDLTEALRLAYFMGEEDAELSSLELSVAQSNVLKEDSACASRLAALQERNRIFSKAPPGSFIFDF